MGASPHPIHLLHVDDDPALTDLVAEYINRIDDMISVDSATSASEGLELLEENNYDCIVSDYDMPGMDGIEFLEVIRTDHPDLPFVLYTGKGSEEIASEAISAGVTDYLQKGNGTSQYTVLQNRIENAVSQYRAQQEIERTKRRYQRLIEESSDVITVTDTNGEYQYVSPAAESVLGYTPDELLGENGFDYIHPDDRARALDQFTKLIENPDTRGVAAFRFKTPDGDWLCLEGRGRNLLHDPVIEGIVVYAREVSEGSCVEEAEPAKVGGG